MNAAKWMTAWQGTLLHDADQSVGIEQVDHAKTRGIHGGLVAARKIVDHDDVVTGVEKLKGCV
jgi:hypothetical protein